MLRDEPPLFPSSGGRNRTSTASIRSCSPSAAFSFCGRLVLADKADKMQRHRARRYARDVAGTADVVSLRWTAMTGAGASGVKCATPRHMTNSSSMRSPTQRRSGLTIAWLRLQKIEHLSRYLSAKAVGAVEKALHVSAHRVFQRGVEPPLYPAARSRSTSLWVKY